MEWGRYIEGAMYEATLEGEEKDRYHKVSQVRAAVLRRILQEDELPAGDFSTKAKIEDVPFRNRPPQADDPDDPFGLWDKSDPVPVPRGAYKDPAVLWEQLSKK